MKTGSLILGAALAVVITVLSGWVQGTLANRWGPSTDVASLAMRIQSFPEEFDGWKCSESFEVDPNVQVMLEAFGISHRRYISQDTQQVVDVFLMIGPPGPISVHTPEICFPSSTYEAIGERRAVRLDSGKDQFWAVDFKATDVHARRIRAYYAWTMDGEWAASGNPRWEFAGEPYLVKFQAVAYLSSREASGESDACRVFLDSFTDRFRRQITSRDNL